MIRTIRLFFSIFILASSVLGGCSSPGNPKFTTVSGTILEERTLAPVQGAKILIWWNTSFGVHATTDLCTWITATETDVNGKYSITVKPDKLKAYAKNLGRELVGGYPSVRFFMSGMMSGVTGPWENGQSLPKRTKRESNAVGFFFAEQSDEATLVIDGKLLPSSTDTHDRIRQLLVDSHPENQCEYFAEDGKVESFYIPIAEEAKKLAKTEYENAVAEVIEARLRVPVGRYAAYSSTNKVFETVAMPQAYTEEALRNMVILEKPKGLRGETVSRIPRLHSNNGDDRDSKDMTALMRAADSGDSDEVRRLLAEGANPNRTTIGGDGINHGYSALTFAIERYGPSFDRTPTGRTPDGEKYVRVVDALLSNVKTNADAVNRTRTCTPLAFSIKRTQDVIVEKLLKAGANPNATCGGERMLKLAERAVNQSMTIVAGIAVPNDSGKRQYQMILNALNK